MVMANLPTGQVSNHYRAEEWNLFNVPERWKADEWDGHTPVEAANRLYRFSLYYESRQGSYDTYSQGRDCRC